MKDSSGVVWHDLIQIQYLPGEHACNGLFKTDTTSSVKRLITNRIIFECEIYVGLRESTSGIKADYGNAKE